MKLKRGSGGMRFAKWVSLPAGVSGTFDTDYLLVKQAGFQRAVDVLLRAGHAVRG
jgi:hypothetical protein